MIETQVTIHYNTTTAGNICVAADSGEEAVKQLGVALERMAAMQNGDMEPTGETVEQDKQPQKKQPGRPKGSGQKKPEPEPRESKEPQASEETEAEAEEQLTQQASDVPDDTEEDVWDDEPDDTPDQSVTLDDIRSLASALGREKGLELLKKHGAKAPKISALPEDAYTAFYEEAQKMLGH